MIRYRFGREDLLRTRFAVSPLFDVAPFAVCGRREPDGSARLWAQDAEGNLAMEASATVR